LEHLSFDDYLAMRAGAEVIEADHYGDKVLRLSDGTYLKLFRRKRLISSAAWYPYAQRFSDNCLKLALRGIPCPVVQNVFRIFEIRRDAVLYQPLEGSTIRQIIAAGMTPEDSRLLRSAISEFVNRLHSEGVLFRSLHLGNIVRSTNGDFGLIDVADMTFRSKPLGVFARERNRRHLFRCDEDARWLRVS
jgi:hypothetical protein